MDRTERAASRAPIEQKLAIPELFEGSSVSTTAKFTHGDTLRVSGDSFKLVVLAGEEFSPKYPSELRESDKMRFQNCFDILKKCAQLTQQISDRLADCHDGLTLQGVEKFIELAPKMPDTIVERMSPYLLLLLKFGSTLHPTRGCTLVPPCPKIELVSALESLPHEVINDFDFKSWIDHIYDPIPQPSEGYYLFVTEDDRRRFRSLLGGEFSAKSELLSVLFNRASSGTLTPSEWKEYDALSQEVFEIQRGFLAPLIANDVLASAPYTRVYIRIGSDATVMFSTLHYSSVFSDTLQKLHFQLLAAKEALPEWATELREVLEAHAAWCVDSAEEQEWGNSGNKWIAAGAQSNLFDVNLTCEERTSHLGSKGIPHLMVAQHVEVPSQLVEPWNAVKERADKEKVALHLFNTVLVGGMVSNHIVAGEKLPNGGNEPMYKSMTFRNVTNEAMFTAQRDAIRVAAGLSDEELAHLRGVPLVGVMLHEFGHTLGDHAAFLGAHGGDVEETNAQASTVYLAARYAPGYLKNVVTFEGCWMPVRRARQGATESHSRSDIALFEEYLNVAGIEVSHEGGSPHVAIRNLDKVVTKAFATALKMRLWEKGIPEKYHRLFVEELDLNDTEQDQRIIGHAISWVEANRKNVEQLQLETLGEVKAYFKGDRMLQIAKKLDEVISIMPLEQPLSFMLSDERYRYFISSLG